ncbi:MAG: hypothetical protein ABSF08_13500 [Candidatus Cybelea sp.]
MEPTSNALVNEMIDAYGGMAKWNSLKNADIHAIQLGATFAIKGVAGVLNDFHYEIDLHAQRGTIRDFMKPGQRATFRPDRVAIETADGSIVEELLDPRNSLLHETLETKWSTLQLVYFASMATWTYLTTPFCFAMPGFAFEDLYPITEHGETWRVVKVTFPDGFARHSDEQIYYVGDDGLIRRHNYVAEAVTRDATGTHHYHDFKRYDDIAVSTRQRIYPLGPDGARVPEPILVAQDIEGVVFS